MLFAAQQNTSVFQVQQSSFVVVRHLITVTAKSGIARSPAATKRLPSVTPAGAVRFSSAPSCPALILPPEIFLERGRDVLHLLRRFVHEFQTEVANTRLTPRIDVRACLLRLRAEDRISAANVSDHRMRTALRISQRHPMLFAWPAAIAVSSTGGKESAEDAMFGVEDGQMLIGDGFQPLRANGSSQ